MKENRGVPAEDVRLLLAAVNQLPGWDMAESFGYPGELGPVELYPDMYDVPVGKVNEAIQRRFIIDDTSVIGRVMHYRVSYYGLPDEEGIQISDTWIGVIPVPGPSPYAAYAFARPPEGLGADDPVEVPVRLERYRAGEIVSVEHDYAAADEVAALTDITLRLGRGEVPPTELPYYS